MTDLVRRRLRAPQEDGAALIDPPLKSVPSIVDKNRALVLGHEAHWQQSLPNLSREARSNLSQQALAYSRGYRDIRFAPGLSKNPTLLLAGHQPELFHPGVWFKSFLLSSLGQRLDALAINLIIDTDIVRRTSIQVPVKAEGDQYVENVAYDAPGEPVPFEERLIGDPWLFDSFEGRVLTAFESCCVGGHEHYEPIVKRVWSWAAIAMKRNKHKPILGRVLAEARHQFETSLGIDTLEIPFSSVTQTAPFLRFAIHLLRQLPNFWRIYNAALAEYRQVNRVRSNTHPVPALQEHDDWLEAPFLLWTAADPRRRHLFVQQKRDSLILTDRHGIELTLDVSSESGEEKAVEQLAAAEARGIKVRPRALITTMYARLVLSDLFIHGIGGAKYDELTDLIIRRFFGIEPPAYMTATATFRLPIDRPDVSQEDVRASARRIRELRYRPESFVRDPLVMQDDDLAAKLAALAAEKREFLDKHDLRRCPQHVFDQFDRLNQTMHDLLRPVEEQLRARYAEIAAQLKQSQLLGSREFSFVLFPSEILPMRLLDLCKVLS
jgi:hypothetical protein